MEDKIMTGHARILFKSVRDVRLAMRKQNTPFFHIDLELSSEYIYTADSADGWVSFRNC